MSISMALCALSLMVLLSVEDFVRGEDNERHASPVCQTLSVVGDRPHPGSATSLAAPAVTPSTAEIVQVTRFERAPDFASFESRKKLLESYLVNWTFFEDLSEEQRAALDRASFKCAEFPTESSAGAVLFERFDASQRAAFVAITHAMLNTPIPDFSSNDEASDALGLVEELTDLHGENPARPSDEQYQMYVRLVPGALRRLNAAKDFERGENHFFHLGYPLSYRQVRQFAVRGQEAGLHISVARDGRSAVIHIDYRFGLLHLGPANSDVRASGNHEKHVDQMASRRVHRAKYGGAACGSHSGQPAAARTSRCRNAVLMPSHLL